MDKKRRYWIFPLILLGAFLTIPYFFWENVPQEIRSEIDAALREYVLPNNPKYVEYKNEEWGVKFDYPSFMNIAAGASNNNMKYAILVFREEDKNPIYGETEMMGVHLLKSRTFEEEIERVGGISRLDLREDFTIDGYPSVRVKEHINPVNEFKESSVVVDQGDMVVSFFLSWKDDEELKSYFEHMIDSFDFNYDPEVTTPTSTL